jgi:hypothetical protein
MFRGSGPPDSLWFFPPPQEFSVKHSGAWEKLAVIVLAFPPAKGGTIPSPNEFLSGFGKHLMPAHKESPDQAPSLLAFGPLHRNALGLAVGTVLGGFLFLATIVVTLRKDVGNPFQLDLLSQFFWGYTVSLSGALIGLLWGFGAGFALGWILAALRNTIVWVWLTTVRSRAEMDQYSDFLDHL